MTTKCRLIIDSCCDLPYEVIDRDDVELLSFSYIYNETEIKDDLYHTSTPHDFFELMREPKEGINPPTTSQLSQMVLKDTFERAYASGIPTVYLSFSSALSGSYDAACLMCEALKSEYPAGEVYVVDTALASVAEGLLVYEAIKQLDRGLSAQEMVKWAEEARYFVNAMFMVDDLESLRRGGRIPSSVAMAGAKLDVKPLLSIDTSGKLTLVGVARGRKKGIKALAEFYAKNAEFNGSAHRAVIADADCPKDAERLKDELAKRDDSLLAFSCHIGPVIGSHVGPDMLAIVFWGPDKRDQSSVAERIAAHIKDRRER